MNPEIQEMNEPRKGFSFPTGGRELLLLFLIDHVCFLLCCCPPPCAVVSWAWRCCFVDVKKLRLSFGEMVILRLSRHFRIPVRFCRRLLRHGLVVELCVLRSPGGMPSGTGFARLSHKGEDYVQFCKSDSLRYWIPVAISLVSLLISILSLIVSISP